MPGTPAQSLAERSELGIAASRLAFRVLTDGPSAGAWNLAVDEAILAGYESGETTAPTLRLYSWSPPALSLGRRQRAEGSHDARFLTSEGIDLVRRPTGGTAVLHERERTYSVTARLRVAPFPGGVVDTYRRIAEALESALRGLGLDARTITPSAAPRARHANSAPARAEVARPTDSAPAPARAGPPAPSPLCFAERSQQEIDVCGCKLVGSAQLRRGGAFLQHGSIVLRADPGRAAQAAGIAWPDAARTVGIEDVLGRALAPAALDAALVAAFGERFDAAMIPGCLTSAECLRAGRLRREKYARTEWTLEGSRAVSEESG